MSQRLCSDRGHLLVDAPVKDQHVLTVELYTKWYTLYLVTWDGLVTAVPFPDGLWVPHSESAFCDHVPNPKAVQTYAEAHNYVLGEFALELIIGRWQLEVLNNYSPHETTIQQARECSVCKQTWPCRC